MRKLLDRLYGASFFGACVGMVTIATLVLIQVLGRVLDRALAIAGVGGLGVSVPSLAEIGGYLFVATIALALPSTLRAAGHVRVTLLLRFVGPRTNRVLASTALVLAIGLAGFAAWHVGAHALDAWQRGSVSYGLIPIPTWIPQATMTLGLGIFTIALVDELVAALRGRDPEFRRAERQREEEGVG